MRIESQGTEEKPDLKKLGVPISFYRDSLAKIATKTCAELQEDVGFHKSADADEPVTKMNLYKITLGMFFLAGKSGVAEAIKLNKTMPVAFEKTIEVCNSDPAALYLEQLRTALKAAP
ncbi:hypothetical protein ABT364_26795 [Massilia sp. SR12]